jgi:hypothetical protein
MYVLVIGQLSEKDAGPAFERLHGALERVGR